MVFDTAGFAGAITAVKTALVEIPADRIVFATDYPQEIRAREAVSDFVRDLQDWARMAKSILSGNVGKLLKPPADRVVRSRSHAASRFSISCTGSLTRSLSTSARSAPIT